MRPYIFKLMDAARDEAARFSAWVKARGLAADDWITLSGRDSNGDKHGGARVLLDDSGAIVYGLGVIVIPKAIDRLKADRYVVSNKKPRINTVSTGEEADVPF